MLFEQKHEVAVFGQHHGFGFSGRQEDVAVFGVSQAEIPDRLCLDVELRSEPPSQVRGELRVYPDDQAATTG